MGHIQAVQRRIAFVVLTHVRMEVHAEKHLALTYALVTLGGVAKIVQKVRTLQMILLFVICHFMQKFSVFIDQFHEFCIIYFHFQKWKW